MNKAKVTWARICLWDKPGGTHPITFLMKNDTVNVTEGWRYEDRTWSDKSFVKAELKDGREGYLFAAALRPCK